MAIEVKQMIIKSTLVHGRKEEERSVLADVDLELLKQEVIEECRELIEQSLNELQER
jgi:hypothetical protein